MSIKASDISKGDWVNLEGRGHGGAIPPGWVEVTNLGKCDGELLINGWHHSFVTAHRKESGPFKAGDEIRDIAGSVWILKSPCASGVTLVKPVEAIEAEGDHIWTCVCCGYQNVGGICTKCGTLKEGQQPPAESDHIPDAGEVEVEVDEADIAFRDLLIDEAVELLESNGYTVTKPPEPEVTHKPIDDPWEFACKWYSIHGTREHLQRQQLGKHIGFVKEVPEDIYSEEFAEWLTGQYRLAMTKGIELERSN